jgi:hypothetical protein
MRVKVIDNQTRKKDTMTVIVTMLNGNKAFPWFDTDDREPLIKFYEEAKQNGQILDYQVA